MKLGIFGANVSNGCAMTMAEGRLETTWPNTKMICTTADRAGFEALVPVARWKGFGGTTNFNGSCFETYTWAAAISAVTEQISVLSTSHVPTVHPILAAKQATTIDHVSDGRFTLNIVCGWFQPELEMFGAKIMEHDERYIYASEWLHVLRLLWTSEEEFDFEGKYFRIQKGFHQPKPIQRPFPAIMNAGGSPVGQRFAAKEADVAFVSVEKHDAETVKSSRRRSAPSCASRFQPFSASVEQFVCGLSADREGGKRLSQLLRQRERGLASCRESRANFRYAVVSTSVTCARRIQVPLHCRMEWLSVSWNARANCR